MATAFQRLQASLSHLENVPEAEIPELPTLPLEYDPEAAAGDDLVRYVHHRGKPFKNLLNRIASEVGIATPRMWQERERELQASEEGWQAAIAAEERIFSDGVGAARQYAMTDIDHAQLDGIETKFQEGLRLARSENPTAREYGARLLAEARQQVEPWIEDIETRRETLIDGELRHLETMYRDAEKDLGIVEGVRDSAVLRQGQLHAKLETIQFDDPTLTERQRHALLVDEIGYMAQSPDLMSGLISGFSSLSGIAAGGAVVAANPYVRGGLALLSALAAGASNFRDLADDFTAEELQRIIDAGYDETRRQAEFRIDSQTGRLNDLERRRSQLSQLPMIRRRQEPAAPATRARSYSSPQAPGRGDAPSAVPSAEPSTGNEFMDALIRNNNLPAPRAMRPTRDNPGGGGR